MLQEVRKSGKVWLITKFQFLYRKYVYCYNKIQEQHSKVDDVSIPLQEVCLLLPTPYKPLILLGSKSTFHTRFIFDNFHLLSTISTSSFTPHKWRHFNVYHHSRTRRGFLPSHTGMGFCYHLYINTFYINFNFPSSF